MSAPAKPSIDEIREALTVFGDSAESAGVRYEQGDRLGRLNAESEGKQARGVVMDAIDELAAARERIAELDQLLNNATRLADEEGEARRQLRARVAELEGYFNPALTDQVRQLRADLEAAREDGQRLRRKYREACDERDAARAELERVKAERDEALGRVRMAARQTDRAEAAAAAMRSAATEFLGIIGEISFAPEKPSQERFNAAAKAFNEAFGASDAGKPLLERLERYERALTALASWKWLPKVAGIARAALARDGEAGSYAGIHLAAEPMPDLRKIGEATADAVLAKMRRDGEKQHTPDCETNSEPCEYNYQRCTCALARDGGEP